MSISVLLLILALICFILAAIPIPPLRLNLIAIGLAFWVAAELIGAGHLSLH